MQKNYWVLKDSELKQMLADHGITLEPYSRKQAVPLIKMAESKEVVVEESDGKLTNTAGLLKDENNQLMVTTVIFHNTSEQDVPYVPVGHNGKAFYIPRETEVEVPDYILNSCIKDAIEDRLIPEVGYGGTINWKKRKVQRFPYTIVEASHPATPKE